jgi:copper chaperone
LPGGLISLVAEESKIKNSNRFVIRRIIMKRATLSIVTMLAFAALVSLPHAVLAGPNCSASKTGASASAKSSCSAHATTADHTCSPECIEICKAMGFKCETISMSVKGMTCGGCEKGIETALLKVDGVLKVIKVSHETGEAMVCVDPTKIDRAVMTAAVVNKGYEAEIIPAVATGDTKVTAIQAGAKHACGIDPALCAKKCASKDAKACASKETKKKDAAEGTN